MDETRGKVRLAEGAPFDVSTRGVTATLRRSDIEQAARSGDEPAELLLDVRRGQGADVEAHSVTVEWSQADLDRLLREAESEDVTIAFDQDEIAAALAAETEVEAHGLREKALVLTVVAVSALSSAGVAQARPAADQAGSAATPVASVAAPAPVQAPATTIGGAISESIRAPVVSPATTIGGAGPAPVAPATTTGGATAPSTPEQVQVRGEAAARTAAFGDGGSLPLSGEDAALIGAAGIAIAAAGFAAAGSRRRTVRPA